MQTRHSHLDAPLPLTHTGFAVYAARISAKQAACTSTLISPDQVSVQESAAPLHNHLVYVNAIFARPDWKAAMRDLMAPKSLSVALFRRRDTHLLGLLFWLTSNSPRGLQYCCTYTTIVRGRAPTSQYARHCICSPCAERVLGRPQSCPTGLISIGNCGNDELDFFVAHFLAFAPLHLKDRAGEAKQIWSQ